jgi:uncharacterized OB-fold protein
MNAKPTTDILEGRPRPAPDALTQGFWGAARRHQLVIQRCDACGVLRHYPQTLCAACGNAAWSWSPVSGRGTIYTFTITHKAFHPAWAGRMPYAVATIELEEGVRMVSDLPPSDTERVAIGLPVKCFFEDHPGEDGEVFTFPRFRLL